MKDHPFGSTPSMVAGGTAYLLKAGEVLRKGDVVR